MDLLNRPKKMAYIRLGKIHNRAFTKFSSLENIRQSTFKTIIPVWHHAHDV